MHISKRLVLGITIPVLILGLGLFLVFAVLKTAKIYIMVAPESATITINGKKVKNGEHNLFPGKKTIKVSGEGIESYETEIDAELFKSKRVAIYRKVNGSYDSYVNSKSDYLILKMLSSEQEQPDQEAIAFLQRIDKAKQFLDVMPKNFIEPKDDGSVEHSSLEDYSNSPNCKAAICILYKSTRPDKKAIKEMIVENGYNYDDYQIVEKKIDD